MLKSALNHLLTNVIPAAQDYDRAENELSAAFAQNADPAHWTTAGQCAKRRAAGAVRRSLVAAWERLHALSTRKIERFTPYARAAQAHGAEPEAIYSGVATEDEAATGTVRPQPVGIF